MKKALLLGAGGPLGALEAGALIALDEKGVHFDVISGACIGSVLALSYSSPANNMTGREALETWCQNSCISDWIYNFFPVNYKIFFKDQGSLSDFFDHILNNILKYSPFLNPNPQTQIQRWLSDLTILSAISGMPSFTNYFSDGISRFSKLEFECLIDFNKLKTLTNREIYINALNLTQQKIQIFDKTQITQELLSAGSSLLFVASPQKIGEDWFGEGSYVDTLNFKGVLEAHEDIKTIVIMNILDKKALIRKPKNLMDSYLLSIMLPFVTIAQDDIKLFNLVHKQKHKDLNLIEVKFDLSSKDIDILDWSASNFQRLKNIGYEAGIKFYNDNKEKLEK